MQKVLLISLADAYENRCECTEVYKNAQNASNEFISVLFSNDLDVLVTVWSQKQLSHSLYPASVLTKYQLHKKLIFTKNTTKEICTVL